MGILLTELIQLGLQSRQVIRHQRHTDSDAHRLGRLDLSTQRRLHLLELVHHRSGVTLQTDASVGKGQLVVGADKQRTAQLRLQGVDALAQRLPGQKQTLCRTGIIHFLAQYQKVVQLADIHGVLLKNIMLKEYRLFGRK